MKRRFRRGPKEPDGWPDPTVDDLALGGGQHESSHRERLLESERQAAAVRAKRLRDEEDQALKAARRRMKRPRRHNRVRDVCIILSVGFLSAAAYFLIHPVRSPSHAASNASAAAGVSGGTSPTTSDVSTSTSIWFPWEDFSPGTCVTWNQTPNEDSEQTATAVPCSQPHLVEIVQSTQQIGGLGPGFPSSSQFHAYFAAHCTAPAERFLGQPIDPQGRFAISALRPISWSWDQGFRSMSCDLQLQSLTPDAALTPWVGDVRGADQTLLWPVGTCQSPTASEVPCTAAHTDEVTGNIRLPGTVTSLPTTNAQWEQLVGQPCDKLALSYLGGAFPPGVSSGWQPIAATSWAVGTRTVQCIVGRPTPDYSTWTPYTGSLQGAGIR